MTADPDKCFEEEAGETDEADAPQLAPRPAGTGREPLHDARVDHLLEEAVERGQWHGAHVAGREADGENGVGRAPAHD